MSTLDDLARPVVGGLTAPQRAYLAHEDRTVATALRERAGVLYAGCEGRAAMAIAELAELADRLDARATTFQTASEEVLQ